MSTEPMSRTLIVSGPTQIFPQVEKVLAELDQLLKYAATEGM